MYTHVYSIHMYTVYTCIHMYTHVYSGTSTYESYNRENSVYEAGFEEISVPFNEKIFNVRKPTSKVPPDNGTPRMHFVAPPSSYPIKRKSLRNEFISYLVVPLYIIWLYYTNGLYYNYMFCIYTVALQEV